MQSGGGGPFTALESEVIGSLDPPVINRDARSLRLVGTAGQVWVVKTLEPVAQQRELFASYLARDLVNAVEPRTLSGRDIARLGTLGVLSPGATPTNTILTRLAHSYASDDLPQRSLDAAVAGELVFSLWIRRRDADVWNRTYTAEGLPVFYDLNACLDFEPALRRVDSFFARDRYGYGGSWRVRERAGESLSTSRLRDVDDHDNLVDDFDTFVREAREMAARIQSRRPNLPRLLKRAGYSPVEIEELTQFMRETTSSLPADTNRMLEVVLQERTAAR